MCSELRKHIDMQAQHLWLETSVKGLTEELMRFGNKRSKVGQLPLLLDDEAVLDDWTAGLLETQPTCPHPYILLVIMYN